MDASTSGSGARAMQTGELAAIATVGLAILVGGVSATVGVSSPAATAPRPLVLTAVFAVPGIVGWLGARSGRDSLFVAASAACALQSIVAFSGVTLVFLVPALLFLAAIRKRPDLPAAAPPRDRRASLARVLVAAAMVPLAILIVMTAGVVGVLAVVVTAGGAFVVRRAATSPPSPGRAVLGAVVVVAIVALHVGAGAALLTTTEEVCWVRHGDGTVDRVLVTTTTTLGPDDVAAGCDGGTFTMEGILLATVALAGEVAVAGSAAVTARRDPPAPPDQRETV